MHTNNLKPDIWVILFVFSLLLVSCNDRQVETALPVQLQTATTTVNSISAGESEVTKSPSVVLTSSNTPTMTSEPTDTSTPRPTFTETSTFTPTNTPIVMVVESNVVCRTGPGLNYDVVLYLSEGDIVTLVGMVDSGNWFLAVPHQGDDMCWVGTLAINASFNTDELKVITPPPSPTWEPTKTPEHTGGMKIFMLALNTGGYFACGDSLMYFYSGIKSSGDVKNDLTRILNRLFSQKSEYVGGYYNPLYKSNLNVKSVDYNPANGHVNLVLGGTFAKPKDKCESDRIRTQIWETVLQLDNVHSAQIWVNNKLLGDLLYVGN